MEPKRSLPCSQEPSQPPLLEPQIIDSELVQSSSHSFPQEPF
jgi:hypothetical protein